MIRTHVAAIGIVLAGCSVVHAAITIGAGPVIGTDTAGNTYNEEFQDWTHADCRVMDGAGAFVGGRYNFNDGFDNSRDLIAFYSRDEGSNYYFRVDLYDLALGAENGNVDIYVAIDCAPGGQAWMPDFTDVQVDPSHAWEVCIKLYDSVNNDVINSSWSSIGGFLGAYFNRELDSVEFGITRQTLLNNGWDGSSVMYFTVMTVKDGSNGGAGEISGGFGSTSDAADTFFDDGRGFDDGVIDGAIASNAGTGRAKYASIAHGNQSINQADDLRVHIYDPPTAQKTGFIRALDTHEIFNVPLNIHMSGSLIVASQWAEAAPGDDPLTDGPAFIDRVAEFVDNDQNDGQPGSLIGGVFAEHIMPYFEGDVNATSIQQFNDLMLAHFGLTPTDVPIMHTPERVIRSNATGLSPLDGLTFEDIENSPYTATYIDEVTHLHWWFYPAEAWSGYNGGFDAPHHHKIHKINNVYCFVINDREDQQKFGNHDEGMMLDVRFTLVDKASQADQAQLTLIFDDWEAMAGKSFDPGAGQSVPNNNQIQYQRNIRWAANHQWIEIVNLKDILDRATNPGNPQYDAGWVVDQGTRTDLSLQTYEWLKHASEDSYHNWYYNENAGFAGNEQDFYDLVPVITGEQGDYHRRFAFQVTSDAQANSLDGPKLPSGKNHGDLNSPGTLMHDAWAAISSAPAGRLKELAELTYTNMIYETAWHEEDDGSTASYQGTNFGSPWPHPDSTWDGLNTWALRLQNHVRSVGIPSDAAQWAEDIRSGAQTAATVVTAVDLDQDGQDEYVIKNNRAYACFERYGGRLTHGYAFIDALNDGEQVIGAPIVNPSEPGEEERLGGSANRCSAFKDMNPSYVDADYSVTLLSNGLELSSPDGKIVKTITLGDGSGTLEADYSNTTGSAHYVRVGASPNVTDLYVNGRDNLSTNLTGTDYTLTNSQGGYVKVHFGTASHNPSPADAGYENRNLALTEQLEVSGNASFSFSVEINNDFCGVGFVPADFDGDCDVDGDDVSDFVDCSTGPAIVQTDPQCLAPNATGDFDSDGDVDSDDFGKLQLCISGAGNPADPNCAN
jgi:hypothetical protein